MANQNNEKIFIEKGERLRFIVQQRIGIWKLFDKLREKYKVKIFKGNGETIVLVEEKEEEN